VKTVISDWKGRFDKISRSIVLLLACCHIRCLCHLPVEYDSKAEKFDCVVIAYWSNTPDDWNHDYAVCVKKWTI